MELDDVLIENEPVEAIVKAKKDDGHLSGTLACTDRRIVFVSATGREYSDIAYQNIERIEVEKDGWDSPPFLLGFAGLAIGVIVLGMEAFLTGGLILVAGLAGLGIGYAIQGEEILFQTSTQTYSFHTRETDATVNLATLVRSTTTPEQRAAAI